MPRPAPREVAGLDCKKYCAHCCYKTVSITPAEAIHIAEYVRAHFSAKALARLKARLRDLKRKTQGMNPEQHGRALPGQADPQLGGRYGRVRKAHLAGGRRPGGKGPGRTHRRREAK